MNYLLDTERRNRLSIFCRASLVAVCNAEDLGSIPGLGGSPEEGNGNPLQYSCLQNSMDRQPGGLQSMVLQSQTRLSDLTLSLSSIFCCLKSEEINCAFLKWGPYTKSGLSALTVPCNHLRSFENSWFSSLTPDHGFFNLPRWFQSAGRI